MSDQKPENKDVVFRRIRGRVVPIRVNRSRSSGSDSAGRRSIGAALVGSGFVAAAAGGEIQKKFQTEAAKMRTHSFRARGLMELLTSGARHSDKGRPFKKSASDFTFKNERKRLERLIKINRKAKRKSKRLIQGAKKTRIAAVGISGALLGTGIERLVGDRQETEAGKIAVDLAAQAGGVALTAAFLLGRRKRPFARAFNTIRKQRKKGR
jgi:hypothetical protein